LREWFAVAVSLLAFLVAAASFYFHDLIRIDDVRLIVNGTVEIMGTRDVGGDVETVTVTPKSLRMTFSNGGNRAFTIGSARLTAEQMDREGKYQACQSGYASLELEPVQLKAGEISIIKEVQASGGPLRYKPCDIRDSKGDLSIRVSPIFEVITPDNQVFPMGNPIYNTRFGPKQGLSVDLSIVVFDRNTGLPAQTLYHRECILGWWCWW
jgi:hypothetical protein